MHSLRAENTKLDRGHGNSIYYKLY